MPFCRTKLELKEKRNIKSFGTRGLKDITIYPNGIYSFEIQLQILSKIKGLEHVKMKRAGYAIEYDFVDPRGQSYIETKKIKSLFSRSN